MTKEIIKMFEQQFKWALEQPELFKSIFYGLICLTPEQWEPMETMPEWWALRLYTRRN